MKISIQFRKIQKKSISLVILAIVICFTLIPSQVFAIDKGFYSSNEILFYDPTDTCSATSSSTGGTSLFGVDNEAKIYNYLLSQGLTPDQSAGLMGNFQTESAGTFSAFIQQIGKSWPSGGWGIAQFDSSGQRQLVSNYISQAIGATTFNSYYSDTYGSIPPTGSGGVPTGVSPTVSDQFLLQELNYITQNVFAYVPSTNSTRTSGLKSDEGMTIPDGMKLGDYIKTLSSASDVAKAWVYLYEWPGDRPATATARAANAATILAKYNSGSATGGSSNTADCSTTTVSNITCPSTITGAINDKSTTAIVNTAKCLTFQPPNSKQQGIDACTTGCASGPTAPANYATARQEFSTVGSNTTLYYGADCGNFVSTVMHMSGADPNFPVSGVGTQFSYMASNSNKYQQVETTTTTDGVQAGDILTEAGSNGHTFIYLGGGQVAQASQDEQMPIQEGWYGMDVVVWRLK